MVGPGVLTVCRIGCLFASLCEKLGCLVILYILFIVSSLKSGNTLSVLIDGLLKTAKRSPFYTACGVIIVHLVHCVAFRRGCKISKGLLLSSSYEALGLDDAYVSGERSTRVSRKDI